MADPIGKWEHWDGPRVGYETFTRPGQATADKLNALPLSVLKDYVRPLRPGEKPNLREEPDVSDTYRQGGRVRRYQGGGKAEPWGKPAPATPKEYGRLLTPAERDAPWPGYTYSKGNEYASGQPADTLTSEGDINEIEGHPTRGLTTDQILWLARRRGQLAAPRNQQETGGTATPRYAGGGAINTGPINHFDTGGQQPFGYDPSAYVTKAGELAGQMTDRGNEFYKWAQDQYNKNEGTANQVIASSLKNAGIFDDAAAAGLSRYQNMYGPAMAQHLAFARDFGSAPRVEQARSRGISSVGAAYDRQSAAAADALRGEGLDPKAIGMRLDSSIRTKRAADSVQQGNTDALNQEIAGQTMLGQSIGLGQADANLTNQFAGVGAANRNQAINAGNATTQTGALVKSASLPFNVAGANELKEWPKAELDAMHASNEQGALWNDINRTGLQGMQIANASGSGAGAAAGAGLGALSSMFRFSPIQLSHGGMIPHVASGGTPGLALGSNWRKFAYTNPVGNPEAIDVDTPEEKKQKQAQYGSQPFEFQWPSTGASSPTESMPPDTSTQVPEPTDSGSWGGSSTYPMVPTDAGTWGGPYNKGGVVKKFYNAGTVDTTATPDPSYNVSTGDYVERYGRKAAGMIPSGYAGFAGDAIALGRDIWDPTAQDEEHTHDIFGDRTQTQGERVGKDVARPVGRAIGSIWGMPQAGADAGEDIGGPVVDFFHGDVGKGFENLGRNVANRGISKLGSMGSMGGMGGMPGGGGGMPGGDPSVIMNMAGGLGGKGGGLMSMLRGIGGGGAGDPGAGTGGSEVTDTGAWGFGGDMGGMGDMGDMGGMGDMGFAMARGGQIPMGPLGHLAHYINGGSAVTGPVTPQQSGAIQTGDTVPASAQVPGIKGPDNVPAMVAAGEGILPKEVMDFIGKEGLKKIIDGAYKRMGKPPQPIGPDEGPTPQAAIQTGPTFASPGAAQGAMP